MRDTHERAGERKEGRKEGRVNHEKLAFVWIPREGGRACDRSGGDGGGKYIDDISAKHAAEDEGGEESELPPPTNCDEG